MDITYTRGLSSPRMESHETILVGSPVVGTDSTAAVDPRLQVDLGCNFFCQAEVADPTMICVGIGYGFFVELTLDEATVSATRPRHPSSPHEHPSPSIMLHPSSVVWAPCGATDATRASYGAAITRRSQAFIEKRVPLLETRATDKTATAAAIKARIKVVLEGLRELQSLDTLGQASDDTSRNF